jgi:hypothetical protein
MFNTGGDAVEGQEKSPDSETDTFSHIPGNRNLAQCSGSSNSWRGKEVIKIESKSLGSSRDPRKVEIFPNTFARDQGEPVERDAPHYNH